MLEPPRATYAIRSKTQDAEANSVGKRATLGSWIFATIVLFSVILTIIDFARLEWGYPPAFTKVRPALVVIFGVMLAHHFGFDLAWKKVFTSAIDFILAAAYLLAWYRPALVGEGRLEYFIWLIPVEFIATCCVLGITLWSDMETHRNRRRFAAVIVFLLAWSMAISYRVGHWWPFVAVTALAANQALSLSWNSNEDGSTDYVYPPWLFRCFLFLLLPCILALWPIPRFGWSALSFPLLEKQLHVFLVGAISPYAIIAFGSFYFLWSALYELTGIPEGKPISIPTIGRQTIRKRS